MDERAIAVTLTRRQLRAARAMTGLSLRALAVAADVGRTTLHGLENGETHCGRSATLDALQRSLENHGIEFGRDGWLRHQEDSPDLAPVTVAPTAIRNLTRICRTARAIRTWTHADFAARLGISPEHYRRVEEGAIVPSLAVLLQLAAALRLSLDDLLGLTHEWADPVARPKTNNRLAWTDSLAERLHRASPRFQRAVMMLLVELES